MRLVTLLCLFAGLVLAGCQSQTAGTLASVSTVDRQDQAATAQRQQQEAAQENAFRPATIAVGGAVKVDIYDPAAAGTESAGNTFAFAAVRPKAPVVLYVHGGGWVKGDKTKVYHLPSWARERGYMLVSTSYRPVPRTDIDGQVSDVARAVRWVRSNIATYGGDPSRIVIMGHSAGAHLVSMVAAKKMGGSLRGVIANDVQAYDLAEYYRLRENSFARVYRRAFGANPANWTRWSPATWVDRNAGFPPFLIMHSRSDYERRKQLANSFAGRLRAKGASVTVFDGRNYTHGSIASRIGKSAEVTRAVDKFTSRVLR